ncbi:pyridoxamine 5'-phosphate oxidase family protein [Saccharothrix obliqua]|uniref:pyridoxamine 5'-phosphate oxidase family protein n=1 Tax=Saccharothrix obliqua TaxID=2861747 RepID=UPI001C601375|nr:pyridoxamine 5'-phosphate oxidase family protein [Saccharothrix obliqua]MBW4721985.1 pyridoxamine 5'-phosphate oxidase family protein [Saccharothrix obliqua]
MPVMTEAQREAFLAEAHVGVISIARPDGPPLAVPIWYDYTPGGVVRVQTGPESVKYRLLTAAREFSLVAQEETLPYRYVSVSGPVVAVEEKTSAADLAAMTHRYFDPVRAAEYLRSIEGHTIATFHMRPERWYSTDYS